jgi:hypothetical protein
MRSAIVILFTFCVSSLLAQPVTVGTMITDFGGTATITSGAPVSYMNLSSYAQVAGTVDKASVAWSTACSSAFKVVFLHNNFSSTSSYSVVAVRGPFNAVAGRNTVTLSPPVTLSLGDVIGVVQLQPYAACGSVEVQNNPGRLGYNLITASDISVAGALGTSSNFAPAYDFGAFAFAADPVLTRIIPAAGAVQGATAFFRTALQLLNPTDTTITGKLVFHPQGQPASASDPALAFTLAPAQNLSYPDVIASMGASGLGSLDILTNGGAVPIAAARVFSDGGSNGTSGFSEEGVFPRDAIDNFQHGILLIPSDLTNFRMNIGIRTLEGGAKLTIATFRADGSFQASRTGVTYPANYFVQVPLSEFTGLASPAPGGWIIIGSTFPSRFFVYSSVVDNRTSDSTYRLASIQ